MKLEINIIHTYKSQDNQHSGRNKIAELETQFDKPFHNGEGDCGSCCKWCGFCVYNKAFM